MSYAATDADRRLGNIIQIGRVKAVNGNLVQVDFDGGVSDWIPCATPQAGRVRKWACPKVGEQVIIASPSGELSGGAVIGSLFQDEMAEPSTNEDDDASYYDDGAVIGYDQGGHNFLVDIPGGGSITLRCGASSITISDAGVAIESPTLTHNGKNVGDDHTHGGVVPGGANTKGPN